MWTKQEWWQRRQYNQDNAPLLHAREDQYKRYKELNILVFISRWQRGGMYAMGLDFKEAKEQNVEMSKLEITLQY